jgi:hypothetical protein
VQKNRQIHGRVPNQVHTYLSLEELEGALHSFSGDYTWLPSREIVQKQGGKSSFTLEKPGRMTSAR